jgi:hypothetical protein
MYFDGVFLSIYSHLLKKFKLSKLCRKKVFGSKNGLWPEIGLWPVKMACSKKSHPIKKKIFFCSFSISVTE